MVDMEKELAAFAAEIGGLGDDDDFPPPLPAAPTPAARPPAGPIRVEKKAAPAARPPVVYSSAPVPPPLPSRVISAPPSAAQAQAQALAEAQAQAQAAVQPLLQMGLLQSTGAGTAALPEDMKAAQLQTNTAGKFVKGRKFVRAAADQIWEDPTLDDWPENDFRIFCGDLGNEVNDTTLGKAFARYPTFAKSKVIRDKTTGKSKGYGFVSFTDPFDCAAALKEMQGKYVGNRPVKLRKSTWDQRDLSVQRKKIKQAKRERKRGAGKGKGAGGAVTPWDVAKEEAEEDE